MTNLDAKFIEREARILDYARAILATYRQATADQIAEGKAWYPRVKALIDSTVNDSKVVLGPWAYRAFSALSPRISFAENVKGFKALIETYAQGGRVLPTVAGTYANVAKAWQYIEGTRVSPIDPKAAPKTARFAANLSGDLSHVTVDVWAARAAGLKGEGAIRGNRYTEIEEAYKRVASITGFKPAEIQAITWIVTRGKGE